MIRSRTLTPGSRDLGGEGSAALHGGDDIGELGIITQQEDGGGKKKEKREEK